MAMPRSAFGELEHEQHPETTAARGHNRAEQHLPDLAAQTTQLVFGAGNSEAQIVFIGEAPGKKRI